MIAYRSLAHHFQTRAGLARFEHALESISAVLKSAAHQLSPQEAAVLRLNVAPELRQVITEGRPLGEHNGRQLVEVVAGLLEISTYEAKRRVLIVLEELRKGISPWDDLGFVDVLLSLQRIVDEFFVLPDAPASPASDAVA